jgi:hypothetical protein
MADDRLGSLDGTDDGRHHGWLPDTLDLSRVAITLSPLAAEELRCFIRAQNSLDDLESITVTADQLPRYAAEVEAFRNEVHEGFRFVVVQPVDELTSREIQCHHWILSQILGTPLVQNSEGDRLIHMWDRDPTARRRDGARYHQTREGGDVHTDNVNIPDPWDYLVVGCVVPAVIGGWNAILSGHAVHGYLSRHLPEAIESLRQDYWWEYRGISDQLYRAPVLTYDEAGNPLFRYLRTYMESAHKKAGETMSERQLWALNVLDGVLEIPDLRLLYKLKAGEILIAMDAQIFHARTDFSDPFDAVSIDQSLAGVAGPLKRTLERTWVRQST